MNNYEQAVVSAMTSAIKKRAGKITALEMFREGYRSLNRLQDKRLVEDELLYLRLDQCVAKRALGLLTEYRRYNNYLNDIIDEYCLVSTQ